MHPRRKPNGDKHWEHMLICVDDALIASHDPQRTMDALSAKHALKAGSVKPPDQRLSPDIHQFKIEDSDDPTKTRWGVSSDVHVKRAADVEQEFEKIIGKALPTWCVTPLSQGCCPRFTQRPSLTTSKLTAIKASLAS
jgi:hypothetical protein